MGNPAVGQRRASQERMRVITHGRKSIFVMCINAKRNNIANNRINQGVTGEYEESNKRKSRISG